MMELPRRDKYERPNLYVVAIGAVEEDSVATRNEVDLVAIMRLLRIRTRRLIHL